MLELDPARVAKGAWSAEEDAALRAGMARHGVRGCGGSGLVARLYAAACGPCRWVGCTLGCACERRAGLLWRVIASEFVPGRSGRQCSSRWRTVSLEVGLLAVCAAA